MSGVAVAIDIEQELEAINRGECCACRIGSTHTHTERCLNTIARREYWCCLACHTLQWITFDLCVSCFPQCFDCKVRWDARGLVVEYVEKLFNGQPIESTRRKGLPDWFTWCPVCLGGWKKKYKPLTSWTDQLAPRGFNYEAETWRLNL